LELIQVWEWRNDYDPNDVGFAVLDGSTWMFSATCGGQSCHCGGVNAYPSFADPQQTTLDQGRYALLLTAIYDCFGIDSYIHQSKLFSEREALLRDNPNAAPEHDDE